MFVGGTSVICKFGSGKFAAPNDMGDTVGMDVCVFRMVVARGKRSISKESGVLRRCTLKSRHLAFVVLVGAGMRCLGLPKMSDVFVYMHIDWNIGVGNGGGAESIQDRKLPNALLLLSVWAVFDVLLLFNGPIALLIAVTSRPPWRKISNFRFFIFGNVKPDDVTCDGGVGDGLLLLSLSLSTKSMISEMDDGYRLLLPRIGVIVVVFDAVK